eukprot:Rhum_TRINITY_DN21293_c0_g1::Rhum_TRINITY_DN21293_c0_g1_i1::g.173651::m.173651/K20347/TMED2, EMP24; p24 family protein beta-1
MLRVVQCLLAACLVACCDARIHIPMDDNGKRCFFLKIATYDEVFAEFVVNSGRRSIDFVIYNPSGDPIFVLEKKGSGKAYFIAEETGRHRLCFTNNHGRKEIMFSFDSHRSYAHRIEEPTGIEEQFISVSDSLSRVEEGMSRVLESQYYLQERGNAMEESQRETESNMTFLSFVQVVGTALFSLWQLYFLRSLFASRGRGV